MASLPEVAQWTLGIYQLETSDPVLGGPEGIDNLQSKQLANRTSYLKQHLDALESGATAAGTAAALATARTIAVTGDGSWSVSFNGGSNVSAVFTLSNSGVTAGSYCKVTVNGKGLVTSGDNLTAVDIPALDWSKITTGKPTTLSDYGVALPTQEQAEAGTDNGLPMTPLRVFQAIAKVLVQATESTFGWAKVATQKLTDTGADDTTVVTPRKLRNGFACDLNSNGYVAFPSWLGGLIVQWGAWTPNATPNFPVLVTFPIAFPTAIRSLIVSSNANTSSTTSSAWSGDPIATGFTGRTTASTNTFCSYIAIGH